MNNNFSLKFKWQDVIVVILGLIISVGLLIGILGFNNTFSGGKRYVEITHRKEVYKIDIDSLTATYEFELKKDDHEELLGDFHILIDKNKGISVHDVTCPNKTCVSQGWVNIPNFPIICIPNDVKVVIKTTASDNGDAVIGGFLYEEKIIL